VIEIGTTLWRVSFISILKKNICSLTILTCKSTLSVVFFLYKFSTFTAHALTVTVYLPLALSHIFPTNLSRCLLSKLHDPCLNFHLNPFCIVSILIGSFHNLSLRPFSGVFYLLIYVYYNCIDLLGLVFFMTLVTFFVIAYSYLFNIYTPHLNFPRKDSIWIKLK